MYDPKQRGPLKVRDFKETTKSSELSVFMAQEFMSRGGNSPKESIIRRPYTMKTQLKAISELNWDLEWTLYWVRKVLTPDRLPDTGPRCWSCSRYPDTPRSWSESRHRDWRSSGGKNLGRVRSVLDFSQSHKLIQFAREKFLSKVWWPVSRDISRLTVGDVRSWPGGSTQFSPRLTPDQ